jgi:hypothetical protein
VIFAILAAIPLLGGLVSFVVMLLGLGALWLLAAETWKQRSAVATA